MHKIYPVPFVAVLVAAGIACGSFAEAAASESPSVALVNEAGGNLSLVGVVSQVFEHASAAYDSQGADDFSVPSGSQDTITEVDVLGYYVSGSGPVSSENVYFYKDDKGTPGALVKEYKNLKGVDVLGNFAIKIAPMTIAAGNYWVSVTVNYPSAKSSKGGGVWTWGTTRTRVFGRPAVWRNPGNGYRSECTKFEPEAGCSQGGNGPGLEFTLFGTQAAAN